MAIQTLEQRASKAPGLSITFLKDKIFGRFESDLEFRLVLYAAAPLYSEHFDPDIALKHNIETVFYAKSHSEWPFRLSQSQANHPKMISIPNRKNISITEINFIQSRRRLWLL